MCVPQSLCGQVAAIEGVLLCSVCWDSPGIGSVLGKISQAVLRSQVSICMAQVVDGHQP